MHNCNPSTQLGGRGRKIRSPRFPSVTPSLRSAYARKHAYSGALACAQRNRHRHNRCTHMHSFYASQEILEKKCTKKNIYESTHNLSPKKTAEKTTVHFLSFPEQRLYTRKQVTHPLIFHQVKNSICFYIVGETEFNASLKYMMKTC